MKVLHILNELKPSGAEVMLEKAAPLWTSLGCDLHILAIADKPGRFAQQLTQAGWQVGNIRRSRSLLKLLQELIERFRNLNPNLIHFHQEGISLPLAFAAWRAGIPMVRTVHNNFPFTGALRWRKSLERALCRSIGCKYIAISSSVQANEKKRFGNPTELCWNWFDSGSFRPPTPEEKKQARLNLGIPSDQFVLLSVGNGSDVKNYKVVIQAMSKLDSSKYFYYQVGNPHPNAVDEVIAKELGIENHVNFVGPRKDISLWLWACDLYVMPSLFEGYGLAAVEALASGCNCLFADCPGLSDFMHFNLSAMWVEPTADEFAIGIEKLSRQIIDPEILAINASTTCELFSLNLRSKVYYDFWKNIICIHG